MARFFNAVRFETAYGILYHMRKKLRVYFERLSPILIDTHSSTSITVGLSKRFLLFEIARRLKRKIEDDPQLNFIAALKAYKAFGNLLSGSIWELYRDRDRSYIKYFFEEPELYAMVREDLAWAYGRNKNINVTITKRGVIIYDNYQRNQFNVLLLTPHSGTWMPRSIAEKQSIALAERMAIEDTGVNKVYGDLVLQKSGIWIDVKLSRFACDYNRSPERAIYSKGSESWVSDLWSAPLTSIEREDLVKSYSEFYITLQKLIDTYRFNIIFDGHSMKEEEGRPDISIGTKFIPHFYKPVALSMRRKLETLGYAKVDLDNPFSGGYILEWMHNRFPDVFVFPLEINKKLYMKQQPHEVDEDKLAVLQKDIVNIFDIDI